MDTLNERRVLTNIRLTDSQKTVLSTIIASPTPQVAADQVAGSPNLIAARDLLEKLGLIINSEDGPEVTETGMDVMKDENLVDETGGLTADGQQFVSQDGEQQAPAPEPETPEGGLPMESYGLIREINARFLEEKAMEELKKSK